MQILKFPERITKIIKILEFNKRNIKLMKILEFHVRTKKNENNVISFENIEHHENLKTQYDNNKTKKKHA